MGVDESGYDDPVRGIDFGHCVSRHGDIRTDFADLSVFDQHVCLCEIADLRVERQYHAALEQDAALSLHTAQFGIRISSVGDLGYSFAGLQHLRHGAAGRDADARFEKFATRCAARGRRRYIIADE